ncbi:MAG: MFS transporter [Clostridia bacterium]|nr:MFS transporter [Clostridia bacterium]
MKDDYLRRGGMLAFGLSGLCAISSGVIVSLLQDMHGFSFEVTGSLLTALNIGNMAAAFLAGLLSGKIGWKKTVLLLGIGYTVGYALCALTGSIGLLMAAFVLIGLTKGTVLHTSTSLVGGHTDNRVVSLQLMHSAYAIGALLCPFLLRALGKRSASAPMLGIASVGLMLYLLFVFLPQEEDAGVNSGGAREKTDRTFLRDPTFWLSALLLFCQNGAEYGVTGWMVTYYKDQQILTGSLSAYAMTIMWASTLIGRLLIAFRLHIQRPFRALMGMGGICTLVYACLILSTRPPLAVGMLILFSLAMAGTNPMITASTGKNFHPASLAVMLPIGSLGGILMPLLIGLVSGKMGLRLGMCVNLIPCAGIFLLSAIALKRENRINA